MARTFNGSSQYLSESSTLLTNEPIDIVIFGNADIATAAICAVGFGNNGANGQFAAYFRGDIASDPVEANKQNDAATTGTGRTSSGFTAGAWAVLGVSFISDTSRAAFFNGASKGTDTTNVSDPTPDFISIGALRRNAISGYFDGSLAEAYVLDVNMTDAQHALAGKGISPFWLVPGKNVRAWYPLQGNNENRVRNGYPNLTATGSPTNGTHPARVLRPRINGVMAT
jgi:hypothetical protein